MNFDAFYRSPIVSDEGPQMTSVPLTVVNDGCMLHPLPNRAWLPTSTQVCAAARVCCRAAVRVCGRAGVLAPADDVALLRVSVFLLRKSRTCGGQARLGH